MSYLKIKSTYFEGENSLNKPDEDIIKVFVENEDDIPFWKDIFDKSNLRTKIYPGSQTSSARGKQEVLKNRKGVGKYLILCVDSDYDYLLPEHTDDSKFINNNPYIFQTYTYSIENYKCYAENLHRVVIKSTLQDEPKLFDYVQFLKKYSKIIYDLFIYSLYHNKESPINFTIDDFSEIIKLNQIDISSQGQEALTRLKKMVEEKLTILNKIPDKQINQLKAELRELGVKPENTYLFIRGHTLYNEVVCKFLQPITSLLRTQKIEQIKETNEEAKTQSLNKYNNSVTDYYECFLMEKIWNDVKKYNQNCNTSKVPFR